MFDGKLEGQVICMQEGIDRGAPRLNCGMFFLITDRVYPPECLVGP